MHSSICRKAVDGMLQVHLLLYNSFKNPWMNMTLKTTTRKPSVVNTESVLPFLSFSQKMILGIKGQRQHKKQQPPLQVKHKPSQTSVSISPLLRYRGQIQRQGSMFPDRVPADGSRFYNSLHKHFALLWSVEDSRWLPGRHSKTWSCDLPLDGKSLFLRHQRHLWKVCIALPLSSKKTWRMRCPCVSAWTPFLRH